MLSVSRFLIPLVFRLLLVLCEPASLRADPIDNLLEDLFLPLDFFYQLANVVFAILFRSTEGFVRFFRGRNSCKRIAIRK